MSEDFLHYLWRFRLIYDRLKLTNGEAFSVIHPGEHNFNAGPDFLNARIRAGSTTWAGNVEVHVRASDWYRHEHQHDDAYRNVILHVVYENDAVITDPAGQPLLTLVLEGNFDTTILEKYDDFIGNLRWIPCEQLLPDIEEFYFSSWAPALAVERLILKSEQFRESWEYCKHDWEACFYLQMAHAFGFRINSDAFGLIAKTIPLKLISKHFASRFQLEALFYGQAGLLQEVATEEYPQLLAREYEYLREKYGLVPVQPGLMRFLRLRPSNFPTIRISQFCALLYKRQDLFTRILEMEDLSGLYDYLEVEASSYWSQHFVFGKLSAPAVKKLGRNSVGLLLMNFVIPFLFFYGEMKQLEFLRIRALSFLEKEPGEMNHIIGGWKNLGMPVDNALQTQALLQLKHHYCDRKRCLECRLGARILK